MWGIVCLLLFCFVDATAFYTGIPGENLWSKTSRIGECLDASASKVCVVAVDTTNWLSILEFVAVTVESLEEDLLGLGNEFNSFSDLISSKFEAIDTSLSDVISEIDKIHSDLLSVSDTIIYDLSAFDAAVSSVAESLIEVIESFGSVLGTDLDNLIACDFGTIITAADLAAGTYTITDPGLYSLCEDAATSANPGISIAASNVTLNLNGHTITCQSSGTQVIATIASQDTIYIHNGNFDIGVGVTNSQCIMINQGSSIFVDTIESNQLMLNITSSDTIFVNNYNGYGVNANINITSSSGIFVENSFITGTQVQGAPNFGVMVSGGSSDVTVARTMILNTGIGIQFVASDYGLVQECTVENADSYSYDCETSSNIIFDRCNSISAGSTGFFLDISSNVLIRDCTATNGGVGIDIENNSNNTVIKRCALTNNLVGLIIAASCSNTEVLETCVVNNGTNIEDSGINTTFINLQTVLEILCSKIERFEDINLSIIDSDISFLDSFVDVALTTLSAVDSAIHCLSGTFITQEELPYIITKPGLYTVCGPLSYDLGPVITNTASDVVINLNGYTIGTDNSAIVSTTAGLSNLVIKNGTIISSLSAIVINHAQGIVLQDLSVSFPAQVGINLTNCLGIFMKNCVICGNNNSIVAGPTFPAAFYLEECGAVVIQNCEASACGNATLLVRGFCINGVNPVGGFFFKDCVVSGASQEAYRIGETSGDLSMIYFLNCQAHNAANGFLVTHTSGGHKGPLFESCLATACTVDFVIDQTDSVLLHNCVAEAATNAGYLMTSSTDLVSAVMCVSQKNSTGFVLDGPKAVCDRCTAIANSGVGFLMSANAVGPILYQCLASRNGSSGINDNNVAASAIVDTRSQDAAFGANPAYNLNGAPDIKGGGVGSVVIRTS